MSQLKLSKHEKELLVSVTHPEPRSLLGFHEIRSKHGSAWIVRVMEPDAAKISLFWEGETEKEAVSLKRIHAEGLFELTLRPRSTWSPYLLKIVYQNGDSEVRHDAFCFETQLNNDDVFLFGEGKHHRVYQKLGAHQKILNGVQGTLFAVWAPNAARVSVVGDFNHWNGHKHPMHMMGNSGLWELFIPKVKEGDVYKYEIKTPHNELLLKCDPYGFAMELRPSTASKVWNLEGFSWKDQEWIHKRATSDPQKAPINIYEVHLGSWQRIPEEKNRFLTYKEASERLIPYVQEMGYTHIELLPIAEFPFDGSWGYQLSGYFAPTSRFGTPQDFMAFVDCCHAAGIGVILDWVPGHFPKDAHALANFDGTPLYEHQDSRQGEHKEWGTLVFNYGRHEVQNFLISNALFWFDLYHIDGIRVDAVASMLYLDYNREDGEWVPNEYGGRENLEAMHFLKTLNETLFHYHPGILSIAEESTAWPGVTHPTYTGGLGFNFKWNMGWMNDTLRYMALDSVYRKYDHHLITFSLMYAFTEHFVLALSHDEVVHGKGSLLDKMPGDLWQKRANLRLYFAFQIAHPGKKLLFMGSEFGQWDEWKASQSLDWHLTQHEDHHQLKHFCKELNWFYRNHSVLYTNDSDWSGFQWIDLHDNENSILSFIRRGEAGSSEKFIVFVFNFTPVSRLGYQIGVPEGGNYHKIMDSDEDAFGGSGANQQWDLYSEAIEWQGQPYRLILDLPPLGMLALSL